MYALARLCARKTATYHAASKCFLRSCSGARVWQTAAVQYVRTVFASVTEPGRHNQMRPSAKPGRGWTRASGPRTSHRWNAHGLRELPLTLKGCSDPNQSKRRLSERLVAIAQHRLPPFSPTACVCVHRCQQGNLNSLNAPTPQYRSTFTLSASCLSSCSATSIGTPSRGFRESSGSVWTLLSLIPLHALAVT